jgi:hypothetical protein
MVAGWGKNCILQIRVAVLRSVNQIPARQRDAGRDFWLSGNNFIHKFQKVLKLMNKARIFGVTKTTKHEKGIVHH